VNSNNNFKTILLVENIIDNKNNYIHLLEQLQYQVTWVNNGIKALEKFKNNSFDLIIVNKNLPYKDAYSLTNWVQKSNKPIPVIYIVSKGDPLLKLQIREKNFKNDLKKVIAELNNKKQQLKEIKNNNTNKYYIGHYTLDSKLRTLNFKNNFLSKLSPKESKMLRVLIENKKHLVTKEVLLKKVWYNNEDVNLKSIGVYITKLRKLLQKDSRIKIINIYKTGFILID